MKKNTPILWAALFAVSGIMPCQAGLRDDKMEIHTLESKLDDLHNEIAKMLNDLNANSKYKSMNPQDYNAQLVSTITERVTQRKDDIQKIAEKITEVSNDTNALQSKYRDYQKELDEAKSFADSIENEKNAISEKIEKVQEAVQEAQKIVDEQSSSPSQDPSNNSSQDPSQSSSNNSSSGKPPNPFYGF